MSNRPSVRDHPDAVSALFSESTGRIVCEVRPEQLDAFMTTISHAAAVIGTVADTNTLEFVGQFGIPVQSLVDAFNGPAQEATR